MSARHNHRRIAALQTAELKPCEHAQYHVDPSGPDGQKMIYEREAQG